MILSVVLRAAQPYAAAETFRLASSGYAATPAPEVAPDFSGLKDITFQGGFAHLRIDPRHQPRIFDVPVAFAFKIAEALGGNLLLNCRERRGGNAREYVRADIGETHVYVNRVIMDAQPGLVVREAGMNFRSHLPENLVVREAPLRDGPNKHITGRGDFIEAVLAAYDKASTEAQALITRTALEDLLYGLLVLADGRAIERQVMTMKRTA